MDNPLIIFLSVLTGLAIGVVIMVIISKAGLNKDQHKASMLLKEAETKADSMVKQAVLDGRTQAHELKIAAEKEIKERKQEVTDMENKLLRREDNLNFRDETLTSKEKQIDVKSAQLADKMAMLDKKDKELQEKSDVQVEELERVASLTTAEAREELMAITEKRMEKARKLLRDTTVATAEIAATVGYKDSHYFSFVFKKTQGVSPRDYRNGKKN